MSSTGTVRWGTLRLWPVAVKSRPSLSHAVSVTVASAVSSGTVTSRLPVGGMAPSRPVSACRRLAPPWSAISPKEHREVETLGDVDRDLEGRRVLGAAKQQEHEPP